MEENKDHIKVEEGMGMVSEPAPTYRDIACAEAIASNMQIFDLENNQTNPEREEYNSIHLGHSLEQVREHCAQFEERRKDASLWSSWEEVNARLHQKHPWLR